MKFNSSCLYFIHNKKRGTVIPKQSQLFLGTLLYYLSGGKVFYNVSWAGTSHVPKHFSIGRHRAGRFESTVLMDRPGLAPNFQGLTPSKDDSWSRNLDTVKCEEVCGIFLRLLLRFQ